MNITSERKYEQLRVYINGVLHLHLKLLDLIGFQSWIHGSNEYYIEYTFKDNTKITSAYQSKNMWMEILQHLSDEITVVG